MQCNVVKSALQNKRKCVIDNEDVLHQARFSLTIKVIGQIEIFGLL